MTKKGRSQCGNWVTTSNKEKGVERILLRKIKVDVGLPGSRVV